jgi:branched-chain amino acid transport system substrate-binding protein
MPRFWMFGTAAVALLGAGPVRADDNTVTIGMILPMTGQQASTGKQERAGAELYMQQHGDTVAGKKIVLEVKDDTGAADVTKRLAEELIGNDHAKALMGFGLTPLALATAPVATEAKVPEIVSAAATAMITEKSPYIVRTSFTLPQASAPMAEWAVKNGWSPVSPTRGPASTPRNGSRKRLKRVAGRSRRKFACRSRIRTSRPSCNG